MRKADWRLPGKFGFQMSKVHRREFLKRLSSAAWGLAGSACLEAWASPRVKARSARPLNFIFILADDLGWTDLGCYGSRFYETPNLDNLAKQGMKFTNAYAACPVCSPTRASILTGKYPARLRLTDWIPGRKQWPTARLLTPPFKQHLDLEELTIPKALKPTGYVSASIGKWHLGDEPFYPEKQGFDLNIAGTRRGSPVSYFGPFDLPGLQNSQKDEYLTDRLTAEALKFISKNRERPFFLYLAHFTVHIPLQAKEPVVARYKSKPVPSGQGHHNPVYAAMIESLDQGVGAILKKLDELRIADRTVIFFTSDNGGLMYEGSRKEAVTSNAPLRAGKGHLYEGGIREPLIIRWRGVVKPGTTCDEPIISVDYFPTILEMAGIKARSTVDGLSIVPLLKQTGGLQREALYWHYPHYSNQGGAPGGAIREGDYKLIEFYEDAHRELYNLKQDVGERNSLTEKEPAKTEELHQLLKRWRASVDAPMPVLNPNYDPAKADQGLTGADPKNQ